MIQRPSFQASWLRQLAAALACLALHATLVRADGETMMPGGAQSIGRSGATAARPTDNMAMLQNPAGLVDLADNQFMLQFDSVYDRVCVDPYGYYGWGVYLTQDRLGNTTNRDDQRSEFGDPSSAAYGNRHLDRLCNSGPVGTLPQLAFSFHVTPRWSVAFGFVAPAAMGLAQWGGKDGTIQTDAGERPTPTRYQVVRTEFPFALNPTASVAFRALPWLSFGATLQSAIAVANSYVVLAMRAGTSPANDALAKLHAVDYFVPSLTFGVLAKPTRNLRLAGTFNWQQGLDGHGDMTITTNVFHQGAVGSELLPLQNDPVKLDHMRVGLPWTATLAARFAMPRGSDPEGDPLVHERWDVEVDASYIANKSLGVDNQVHVANDFTLEFRRADGTPQMPLTVTQNDIQEISVEKHTYDVLALRLGGSVNVIPGRLQFSLGSYYQTRGVDPSYASVDAFNFRRVGVSLGVLVRLGHFDVTAAYAHVFQETMLIAPPNPQPRTDGTADPTTGFDQRIYQDGQLSAEPRVDPKAPSPNRADGVAKLTQSAVFEADGLRRRVVNAGRYTAGFNVLSIGASYHF
jgi:hypothetical protein